MGKSGGAQIGAGRKPGREKVQLENFVRIVNEYIKDCDTKNKPPLLGELCLVLNIDRETLRRYRQKSAYCGIIKRIDEMSENYWIKRGNEGNKPIFAMFMLKSKHGYIEQQYSKVEMAVSGSMAVIQMPSKKPKIVSS